MAKRDIRELKARQQLERLKFLARQNGTQPKPASTGTKTVSPATKSGPITGDNASDPFIIGSLPYTDPFSTSGFNDDYEADCPSFGPGSPDVVYKYYADHEQFITIDVCDADFDTRVYVAYSSDEFSFIACNDDWCGIDGLRSRVETFYLYSGAEILITVDGYDGAEGNYLLNVFEVFGEDVSDPIIIPAIPYAVDYTTDWRNDDYDEVCPFASTSADVVFAYTPQDDQQVTVDLCGSSYDTKVFVYENSVTPGSPFACNEDDSLCPAFQSRLECLDLFAFNTYYIVIDGWGNQTGGFFLDIYECAAPCWTECVEGATPDGEICPEPGPDTVNGGCWNNGPFQQIEPSEIVCGSVYADDAGDYDVDWYARYFFEGDSLTWKIVTNFPVFTAIVDLSGGCTSSIYVTTEYSLGCDTIYLGYRVPADAMYGFTVENDFDFEPWLCEYGPQYQAQLLMNPTCRWAGCPLGAIEEGELCIETATDDYNGGCYVNPPAFSVIPDNQYVCGSVWRSADNWDEDVYKRHMMPGETVTFSVQAEFPVTAYIYDIGGGCVYSNIVDYAANRPCEITILEGTANSETDFAFVVFATDVGNRYPCETGPWEYTAVINRRPDCPDFACSPGATPEGENCEITELQSYNAGCNENPPSYGHIAYDETVCGTCWYGQVDSALWRDTDWHIADDLVDGDSVVWAVSAEFGFDAFIIDVSPDCDFDSNVTVQYLAGQPCDTVYLTTRVQPGQNLRFALAPNFFTSWLWCEFGDWNWQATLTRVPENCCDCAHDPICDSIIDVFDVVAVVNVAFRNGAALPDPNGLCPADRTNVDCDADTDVFDVIKFVDVAFRNGNPEAVFCNPCVSIGSSSSAPGQSPPASPSRRDQ